MGLAGNFAALEGFARKLEGASQLKRELLDGLGEEVLELIAEGFDAERAPDGAGWPPKIDQDGRKTLSGPTGNLKSGWHRKSLGTDSVTVGPSVFYASVHQSGKTIRARSTPQSMTFGKGTKRRRTRQVARGAGYLMFQINGQWVRVQSVTIPPRPMVPEGVLPPQWAQQLREAAIEMLRDYLA